jgi:hypothetical protein
MATWAATELCEVTDVQAYFRDIHKLMATESSDPKLRQETQTKINLVKADIIRPEVHQLARVAFPNTLSNLKRFARKRYRQYLEHANADRDLSNVDSLLSSPIADVEHYANWYTETYGTLKPYVWHSAGVPGASTHTSATNGDFCIDTTNERMYINRSATTTPDWEAWTAESAEDYIYDSTVLRRWAVYETALLMVNDRATRNFLTGESDILSLKDLIYEQIHGTKDSKGIKTTALRQLRFDISGDNSISDYENESTGDIFLGFA